MNCNNKMRSKTVSKERTVADETMNLLSLIGNGLLGFGAWVLMYTGLPVEPAAILATLMVIDFFAGVSRAHVVGESITSHRIKIGAASKCGVLTIPLVMALAAKGLGSDFNWLVQWTVSLFILSESYSIIANIYTARTGIVVPEWDAVSLALKKVRSLVDELDKRN